MRIRFVKDWTVKQGDGKGPVYTAGQVVEFNGRVEESYGRKYVARKLAVEVTSDSKPAPAPTAAAAPKDVPDADAGSAKPSKSKP